MVCSSDSLAGADDDKIGIAIPIRRIRVIFISLILFFAPGVTRTPDPRIRNPMLYPAELRAQMRPEYVAERGGKSSGNCRISSD